MATYTVTYRHAAGHTATVEVEAVNKVEAVAAARTQVGSRWSFYEKSPVRVEVQS